MVIFGTRPEAIKFAPLIQQLGKAEGNFRVKVCVTAQHKEMLDQVLQFFRINPDINLHIMKPNQSLFGLTSDSLREIEAEMKNNPSDLVFVQGDTTTALIGALAGFYSGVKVAHLEAGLRSGYKRSPFPEEMNRKLVGQIADYHFAPTPQARLNLHREGIKDNIWIVGNTVVDALFLCLDILRHSDEQPYYEFFKKVDFSKKILLVTGHRRESFGKPFKNICGALTDIAFLFRDVQIVYPVHLNPKVKDVVHSTLGGIKNIHLMEPLEYNFLVWLMKKSFMVLTDSGGIQEEAPSLGKPVLVMREVTERIEGIDSCTAELVGTERNKIVNAVSSLLTDDSKYQKMAKAINPYGDGKASQKIVEILRRVKILEGDR